MFIKMDEIKTYKTKKMGLHLWYTYKPGKRAITEIKLKKNTNWTTKRNKTRSYNISYEEMKAVCHWDVKG